MLQEPPNLCPGGLVYPPQLCYSLLRRGGVTMCIRLFVLLSIFVLVGCGGGYQTTGVLQSVPGPAPAADCRQPKVLYDAFRIHARELTWKGSQLTAVFEVRNIGTTPVSVSGEMGALVTIQIIASNGTTFNETPPPTITTTSTTSAFINDPLSLVGVNKALNPGAMALSRHVFDAPKGVYTLQISRTRYSGRTQYEPEIWNCLVPAI
jgi:hypothetical protein